MILVTGGTGYVGSLLVAELLALGEHVRVVDTQWFGNPFSPHPRLDLLRGDLCRFEPLWLRDIDAVVHLAGLSNDPTADFAPGLNSKSNVFATRLLAEAVAAKATQDQRDIRFLFASTCSVYHAPTSTETASVAMMTEDQPVAPTANYGKTKRLAEIDLLRIAEQHERFCPVILRKGTIFGLAPRMRFDLVVNAFTLNAWRNRLLTVHGSGEAWRPLLHIRDAVDAYVHLLATSTNITRGQIFNLAHKNYRVLELAHWIAEVLEHRYTLDIRVKRDRTNEAGARSYFVDGAKIARTIGFRAERGVTSGVIPIWEALERGDFGAEPERDPRFFNILSLRQTFADNQTLRASA